MPKLSEREKLLLDTLANFRDVKTASYHLIYDKGHKDLNPNACYAILFRIRERRRQSRQFINTILAYTQKSPLLKKVLTPKVPMKDEE